MVKKTLPSLEGDHMQHVSNTRNAQKIMSSDSGASGIVSVER